MKRTIMTIIVTMTLLNCVVSGIACHAIVKRNNQINNEKIEHIKFKMSESLVERDKLEQELNDQINDLNDDIYNIINGKDYEVTITHDGTTYTYTHKNDKTKLGKLLKLSKDSVSKISVSKISD